MIIRKGIEIQTAQSPQGGRGGDPFGSRNWGDTGQDRIGRTECTGRTRHPPALCPKPLEVDQWEIEWIN